MCWRQFKVVFRVRPIYSLADVWVLLIYWYRPKRTILSASAGVDKTLLYSSHIQTPCARKHNEPSQDSYLTATLQVRFHKKADKMNHGAHVIIINQINWKPRQNIEIATIWNILTHKSWFLKFMKKKVRHKIHCIFEMKQKIRFKNLEISVSVHEWLIYQHRYRPQKSYIGRSLVVYFRKSRVAAPYWQILTYAIILTSNVPGKP